MNKFIKILFPVTICCFLLFSIGCSYDDLEAESQTIDYELIEKIENEEVFISKSNDSDKDSISDYEEYFSYGTDLASKDSDKDSFDDKTEITSGYDPLIAANTEEDFTDVIRFKNLIFKSSLLDNYCYKKIEEGNVNSQQGKRICKKGDKIRSDKLSEDSTEILYLNIKNGDLVSYSTVKKTTKVTNKNYSTEDMLGVADILGHQFGMVNSDYNYLGKEKVNNIDCELFRIADTMLVWLRQDNGLPVKYKLSNIATIIFEDFNFTELPDEYFKVPEVNAKKSK